MSNDIDSPTGKTPETEAFCSIDRGLGTAYYQALDFARKLERERNDLKRRIREFEDALTEATLIGNEWCAEYVKARDAIKAIYDDTEGDADGAPDASDHDKLCNHISSIASPWKDAQTK